MTLTVSEMLAMKPSLDRLANRSMPIQYSFQLARIVRVIGQELDTFYTEREKLLDKYGAKDEKGELIYQVNEFGEKTGVRILEEFTDQFTAEMEACLAVSVEIPGNKVDLTGIDLMLSVSDILKLEPILIFPEE